LLNQAVGVIEVVVAELQAFWWFSMPGCWDYGGVKNRQLHRLEFMSF